MSVLCYCKKCGRRVFKEPNIDWVCDYCNNKLFAVPDQYLHEKCKIAFKNDDVEEQFINEYIKSSPEFNQYLFDHRDEDLAARRKQRANDMARAKATVAEKSRTPKCPSCGSTNISKIGAINRAVSVGIFGLASGKIGKTHKCNKCGSMW